MAPKTSRTAAAVSPEEHDARMQLAKAMFFVDLGESKPQDPLEAQAAFDAVRNEWIGNAIRVKKNLGRLGYELQKCRPHSD